MFLQSTVHDTDLNQTTFISSFSCGLKLNDFISVVILLDNHGSWRPQRAFKAVHKAEGMRMATLLLYVVHIVCLRSEVSRPQGSPASTGEPPLADGPLGDVSRDGSSIPPCDTKAIAFRL